MSNREDFEKLPQILCLMQYVTCFDGLKYVSDNKRTEDYLNGAWDTYQVQQTEIDSLKEKLARLEKWAEFHIEDYNLSGSDSEHDRGWFNAACQVIKLLKEK